MIAFVRIRDSSVTEEAGSDEEGVKKLFVCSWTRREKMEPRKVQNLCSWQVGGCFEGDVSFKRIVTVS